MKSTKKVCGSAVGCMLNKKEVKYVKSSFPVRPTVDKFEFFFRCIVQAWKNIDSNFSDDCSTCFFSCLILDISFSPPPPSSYVSSVTSNDENLPEHAVSMGPLGKNSIRYSTGKQTKKLLLHRPIQYCYSSMPKIKGVRSCINAYI